LIDFTGWFETQSKMFLCILGPGKKNFVLCNFIVSMLEVAALLGTCYRENWERKIVLSEPHVDEKSFYNNFLIVCWCFLTLSLAVLVMYAVKKESHYLCNTWFMCECLMVAFVLFISIYIYAVTETPYGYNDNISFLRHPRMKLVIVLHIFLKMYGLWVISDFMNSISARFTRISSLIQSVHPNLPPIIISNLTETEKSPSYTFDDQKNTNEENQEGESEKEKMKEREFKESFNYQRLWIFINNHYLYSNLKLHFLIVCK